MKRTGGRATWDFRAYGEFSTLAQVGKLQGAFEAGDSARVGDRVTLFDHDGEKVGTYAVKKVTAICIHDHTSPDGIHNPL